MSTPSRGSAFSDGVRIGSYQNSQFNFGCIGVSQSPRMTYSIVPGANANMFNNTIGGASKLALTAAGTTTVVTYQGYPGVIKPDFPRGLSFQAAGDVANDVVFTISGWDIWGQKVVENVTIVPPSTDVVLSKKTYAYINSIYASRNSNGENITIATSSAFGFPFYCPDEGFALVMWGGRPDYFVTVTGNGSFYLRGAGSSLSPAPTTSSAFIVGDSTSPATATTGDPRGLYFVNPALAPDGSRRLVIDFYVPGFDPMAGTVLAPSISSPSQAYCYGVSQYANGWQ